MRTLVIAALLPLTVAADCMRDVGRIETICGAGPCVHDRYGEVYCAPHIDGSALLDRFQNAVCSAGQCAQDRYGEFICSVNPGGSAVINHFGDIDCYGDCAPASSDQCEREIVGPRDENGELITDGTPPTGEGGYRPPGRSTR